MFVNAQTDLRGEIVLEDKSILKILGSANVSNFKCNYEAGFESDTLAFTSVLEDNIGTIVGDTLNLKINAFDCGRRGINRDLRKTLKYDEFPTIDVSLKQFVIEGNLFKELKATISIAGIQNDYSLEFDVKKFNDNYYQVTGNRKINMSDFDLVAPRALMGLVRVDDELTITYNLFIRQK